MCGRCIRAGPRPAATLHQQTQTSMSAVHAANDSEVESLCLDHTSPAAPPAAPHPSDSELQYLYLETADKLSAVPVIKMPQMPTQRRCNSKTKTFLIQALLQYNTYNTSLIMCTWSTTAAKSEARGPNL